MVTVGLDLHKRYITASALDHTGTGRAASPALAESTRIAIGPLPIVCDSTQLARSADTPQAEALSIARPAESAGLRAAFLQSTLRRRVMSGLRATE